MSLLDHLVGAGKQVLRDVRGRWHADFENRLASRLPGREFFQPRLPTVDWQVAPGFSAFVLIGFPFNDHFLFVTSRPVFGLALSLKPSVR